MFYASRGQEATNNHMHSYKSPAGRLESHQRGFWIETLLWCPGDLLSKSSKLTFSKKRWWGDSPPVNVRRVGGKHNTVKQADSGFGGRCSRKSRGTPEAWSRLCICQASSSWPLPRAGFPMLAPGKVSSAGGSKRDYDCGSAKLSRIFLRHSWITMFICVLFNH